MKNKTAVTEPKTRSREINKIKMIVSAGSQTGTATESSSSESALINRIRMMTPATAKRYAELAPATKRIAAEGIARHFRACDKHGVAANMYAVMEIIDDALDGRRIWAEVIG